MPRKYLLAFALALLTPFACAKNVQVVISIQPYFDLVQQIVGEHAELTRILPVGASPHTYDPTPQDIVTLSQADLIVMNGEIDAWLRDLIEASGSDAPVVILMDEVNFTPIAGEAHDHEHGHDEEEGREEDAHADSNATARGLAGINPHIWLDPSIMQAAIPVLVQHLSKADSANAAFYQKRGAALTATLKALDDDLKTVLRPVSGQPFVPFHDAWPYFARRYGLEQVAVIESAPGREPSPSYIAQVLGQIAKTGAKAIFNDVQLPGRPAEIIAEEAGVALYTLDPEGGGSNATLHYQDLLRYNAKIIARALQP